MKLRSKWDTITINKIITKCILWVDEKEIEILKYVLMNPADVERFCVISEY